MSNSKTSQSILNKYAKPHLMVAMAKAGGVATVRLPMKMVEELYDTSVKFAGLLETLEVLMDKQTMKRLKTGEREYASKKYVVAKGSAQIRKPLSS